jgi:hypothetical protein
MFAFLQMFRFAGTTAVETATIPLKSAKKSDAARRF